MIKAGPDNNHPNISESIFLPIIHVASPTLKRLNVIKMDGLEQGPHTIPNIINSGTNITLQSKTSISKYLLG